MEFKGKKALVCGMARSGVSAAELLKRLFAFCEERDFRLEDGELEKALEAFMKEVRKAADGDGKPEVDSRRDGRKGLKE